MARVFKQQNFSGFDLAKLQSNLYELKVIRGTTEYLARFVGWEKRETAEGPRDLALFAVRNERGTEDIRALVFDPQQKVEEERRLKLLFALVFAGHNDAPEWTPSTEEIERVK